MKRRSAVILGAFWGIVGLFSYCSTWKIALAEDTQYLPIGPFGTLNNTDNSLVIPSQKAQDLLNVNISPGGSSVKKREGYAIAHTLTYTTSPVHGTHYFYDSGGNDVAIAFHDAVLSASISGGTIANVFTNGPNGATWQCVDSQGFAYCANTSRSAIIKTNGSTSSNLTGFTSTGTLVAVTPERLVQAGFSGSPNDINFSKANDFTTWTVGGNATDPVSFTITAPGPKITHITYAFDRIVWFKNTSFGYIMIGNQPNHEDWQVVIVDSDLGTLDNTSVFREGILYFRGQDSHLYSFDGSNLKKLTRDIQATITASQSRASNSWTQTSQSDFQAGATSPAGYIDTGTVSGSLFLASGSAVGPFIDTSASDFGSATTITNVDTTTISGSVLLSLGSNAERDKYTADDGLGTEANTCVASGVGGWIAQSFVAQSSYVISSISVNVMKEGSPADHTLSLYSDSSNSPNTQLVSATLPASSITTSHSYVNVPLSSYGLNGGTTYWVRIDAPSSCSNSTPTRVLWALGSTATVVGIIKTSGGTTLTVVNADFINNGKQYSTSGSILSQSFDSGFTTSTWLWSWGTLNSTYTSPTNTTIAWELQSSTDPVTNFNTLTTVSANGGNITIPILRYIRYKTTFTTSNVSTSPVMMDTTISGGIKRRPSGIFYSAVKNASSLTSWDSFSVTKQDNGGSLTFYIRSSTNSIEVTSSTPTWTAISNGGTPSISTGTYFQIRSDFLITSSTHNPTINDFTQNWFEGTASDKSYATYHRDAIWWAVASGAGASGNNKILYYDMLNDGMTLYDIASNGFYVKSQSLYFGSSTSGYIFKFGSVNSDNGSAINAYWKSKDFVVGTPFQDKEYVSLSFAADAVTNSSMTVTYTLNGSSSTSYTIPLQSNNSYSFIKNNKNLPAGKIGQTFNVQFSNNATDQPYEVFGIQAGYRTKPWRPE